MNSITVNQSRSRVASIVIPIRARKAEEDAINRLERLLHGIPTVFEVIVVDDGSHRPARARIHQLTLERSDAQFIGLDTRWRRFSLARSRNRGAWAARTPVVIFHDVDFIGSPAIYHRLESEIRQRTLHCNPENFFCVPVAFLTESATRQYLADLKDENNLEYWSFSRDVPDYDDNIMHFVRGSSCIVMNRQQLVEMGGHDETYDGHGAEDFELLHRLAECFPIAEKPKDYSVNTGSGPINEYRGFRAYFALYGDACHRAGCVLVHLYHPARKGWGYYQHKRNFNKLKKLMTQ